MPIPPIKFIIKYILMYIRDLCFPALEGHWGRCDPISLFKNWFTLHGPFSFPFLFGPLPFYLRSFENHLLI